MAPKRHSQAQPQRRSSRIASRASSIAASESVENNDVKPLSTPRCKSKNARQIMKAQADTFGAAVAIAKIISGDLALIKTLTKYQKDAVIVGFRNHTTDLADRLRELERRNEQLEAERDEAKKAAAKTITIRDAFFKDRLDATREKLEREAQEHEEQRGSRTPGAKKSQATPLDKQPKPIQAETAPAKISLKPIAEPRPASPETKTPKERAALSSPKLSEKPDAESTPTQQPSIFGRILSTIASPFSLRRSTAPTPRAQTPQQEPTKPLGELSTNRKRRAEEPAPEEPTAAVTSTPQQAKTPRHFSTLPSARNPIMPSTLKTIAERSELTEESILIPEATPSRPPRSVSKMRRAAREQEKLSKTPGRSWTHKPTPREPNADARLEKLRHFQELNSQVEALREDEELREMVQRPVKRVKIDKLVSIPHNRPGDPSSTFRVYEVDSDDEMEVDADEQVRDNIFEIQEKDPTPEPPTLPPAPAAPAAPTKVDAAPPPVAAAAPAPFKALPPAREREKPREVFHFPSVGKDGPTAATEPPNELAALKFRYGFAMYQKHGTLIPW